MKMYRMRYEYPDGRRSLATFTAAPSDALAYAAAYVRAFVGGYLLAITEEHSQVLRALDRGTYKCATGKWAIPRTKGRKRRTTKGRK